MRLTSILLSILSCILVACTVQERGEHELIIGAIAGPEIRLLEVAQKVAQQKYQLKLTIIPFEDYIMPNVALQEGAIDANMFQHQSYLDLVMEKESYPFVVVGQMFIYPMGLYAHKIKHIEDLPRGAIIGVPNDPTNEARALRLLAQAKLLTLSDTDDLHLTPAKIIHNPYNLHIKEISAAQLPRVLRDLDAAVINTNYALPAGLLPSRDALVIEQKNPAYVNVIVVRKAEQHKLKFQQLITALHSEEVQAEAVRQFHNQAIPAW